MRVEARADAEQGKEGMPPLMLTCGQPWKPFVSQLYFSALIDVIQ